MDPIISSKIKSAQTKIDQKNQQVSFKEDKLNRLRKFQSKNILFLNSILNKFGPSMEKYNTNTIEGKINLKKLRTLVFDHVSIVDKTVGDPYKREEIICSKRNDIKYYKEILKKIQSQSEKSIVIETHQGTVKVQI